MLSLQFLHHEKQQKIMEGSTIPKIHYLTEGLFLSLPPEFR